MNNDLISREALKKDFKSRLALCNEWIEKAKDKETKIRASAVKAFIAEVLMTIDNAPSVETYTIEDIQEVRENALILGAKLAQRPQGEWKLLYKGDDNHCANYECSICQREIYFDAKTESLTDYPFCHCGADMRKGGAV